MQAVCSREEKITYNVRDFESYKIHHLSLKIAWSALLKSCFREFENTIQRSGIEFHPGIHRKYKAANLYTAGQINGTGESETTPPDILWVEKFLMNIAGPLRMKPSNPVIFCVK